MILTETQKPTTPAAFLPFPVTVSNCPDQFDPEQWIIKEFLPAGVIGGIIAEGGTGKSWFLMELAFCASQGRELLRPELTGKRASCKVVYLNGEDSTETLQRRLARIKTKYSNEDIEDNLFIFPMAGKADKRFSSTEIIEKYLAEMPRDTKLIIIDPISQFLPDEAEEKNSIMGKFIEAITIIREHCSPQTTVLISHHVSKAAAADATGRAHGARGASALTDGLRWIASMTPEEVKGNSVRVIPPKWDMKFNYPYLIHVRNAKNNNHSKFKDFFIYQGDGGTFLNIESGEKLEADGCRSSQWPQRPERIRQSRAEKPSEKSITISEAEKLLDEED